MTVKQKFIDLCLKSKAVDDQNLPRSSEPEYREVLDHVLSNMDQREEFGILFVNLIKPPTVVYPELAAYCMHILRWDEVKISIDREVASGGDRRLAQALSFVRDAFEDDWNDQGYFEYEGLSVPS